jgi:hypothetical protein
MHFLQAEAGPTTAGPGPPTMRGLIREVKHHIFISHADLRKRAGLPGVDVELSHVKATDPRYFVRQQARVFRVQIGIPMRAGRSAETLE